MKLANLVQECINGAMKLR